MMIRIQRNGIIHTLVMRVWNGKPPWKIVSEFHLKLEMNFPCNLAIALLDIYPREMITCFHPETYTQIGIAALFVMLKTWKLPKCPSVDEWWNCAHAHHRLLKRTRSCYTQSHGWTSRKFCWGKKANLKRTDTTWVHLYKVWWNNTIIEVEDRLVIAES